MSRYFDDVIAPLFNEKVFVIPKDYTEITDEFYEMLSDNGFEGLEVEEGNPVFYAKDNCIINKFTKTLVLGCKNSIIPDDGSVVIIGEYAFSCCDFEHIVIPEGIEEIGFMAFSTSKIDSVSIPASVKKLGNLCFSLNGNLQAVILNGLDTKIGNIAFGTKKEYDNYSETDIPESICNNSVFVVIKNGFKDEKYLKDNDIKYDILDM